MTYEEMKSSGSKMEIIPCKRMQCKGAAPCVLNINSYMNVYEFEDKIMKYMCNMRPVMDEFICVDFAGIEDRPVDFIQSLVESYIRYDSVRIKKNYRVEYGKLDKTGKIISTCSKHLMGCVTTIWLYLSSLWCALKVKLRQIGTGKR